MAFNYSNIAAIATKVIADFGKSLTLRNAGTSTYDPATGVNTLVTTDVTIIGTLFDIDKGRKMAAGGLVEMGDKECLIDSTSAPVIGGKVIDGTVEYSILGFEEINPAGTSIMYTLHLRAS